MRKRQSSKKEYQSERQNILYKLIFRQLPRQEKKVEGSWGVEGVKGAMR